MDIEKFLNVAERAKNVGKQYETIDILGKENPEVLIELYSKTKNRIISIHQEWQLRAITERIIDVLCLTNGKRQITTIFRIIENGIEQKKLAYIATLLAQNQGIKNLKDELILLKENTIFSELICLIIHQLIILKYDLTTDKIFYDFAQSINDKSLIFNKLPLILMPIEKQFNLRSYGIRGSSSNIAFGHLKQKFMNISTTNYDLEIVKSDIILSALLDWKENSNGELIGINGTFKKENIDVLALIISIHNELNPIKTNRLKIESKTLGEVFSMIFSASANGGAYTRGEHGAIGRLKTWETLAGFCNLEFQNSSCETITDKLMNYEFYEFLTDSNWFHNLILDLGVFAVNKKTKEFSLLAATDID